jgi:hypothetical protein
MSAPGKPLSPPSADLEKPLFYTALAAALAILLIIAWPMLAGKVYVYDDLGRMHIPMRMFFADCLAQGDDPAWMPSIYCGLYLQGEGQVGMYHPLHRFLYGFLPFSAAFNIEFFLSYPVALAGMYLFLRRWKIRRDAAMLGALLFAFSGFNLLHFMHLHCVAIVSQIPWLLLSIDVAVRSADKRSAMLGGLGITLFTASQILLGHLQFVWMSSLAEAAYVLILRPHWRGVRTLGFLAGAKALGMCLGAIQLVPNYDAFLHSDRNTAGYRHDQMSLQPANLFQLVGPYLFKDRIVTLPPGEAIFPGHGASETLLGNLQEFGIYGGSMTLVLFACAAVRVRGLGTRKRLVAGMAILAGAALVLALGKYAYVYSLISRVPFVAWFRAPCRYMLLVQLAMAVGAAAAFERLCQRVEGPGSGGRHTKIVVWAIVAASAVTALMGIWPGLVPAFIRWPFEKHHAEPRVLMIVGPALFALAALLVLAVMRGARKALFALVLFAAADQAVYGLTYVLFDRPRALGSFVQGIIVPPEVPEYRVVPLRWDDNASTLRGFRLMEGYAGMRPNRVLNYGALSTLRIANAKWFPEYWISPVATVDEAPPPEFWQVVPGALPRARMVTGAVVSPDPATAVEEVDVATTAVTAEKVDLEPGFTGMARITSDHPGHVTVATQAPSRQLLILSERYYDGWKASVDGQAAKVLPVYGDFMGVVVDKGAHEVQFKFDPESLRTGATISSAALAVALIVSIWLVLGARGGRH